MENLDSDDLGFCMASNRQRLTISIPLIKKIRLFLWGRMRDLTTTEMAERIVIDRVSNPDNWDEAVKDLQQEAAIAQKPLREYVKDLLREEFKDLPVDEIDWTPLIGEGKSAADQLLQLLESDHIDEAIALLKSLKPEK